MAYSSGNEGQLYVSGTLCNAVSSVKIPRKRNTGKVQGSGHRIPTFTFSEPRTCRSISRRRGTLRDAGMAAIKAAFESSGVIQLRAIDGTSGDGVEGDFGIESRDLDQPLNEAQKITIKALPHAKGAGRSDDLTRPPVVSVHNLSVFKTIRSQHMFRTSIGGQCNSLGLGVPINIQIDSDAGEGFQDEIAAGAAGSLTTRTDANTGVVTLGAGHSIVTGKVDVAWTGGARCNMDATVNGNACTIDGGEGDDLPIATTTVVVSGQTSTGRDLVGDHLDVL